MTTHILWNKKCSKPPTRFVWKSIKIIPIHPVPGPVRYYLHKFPPKDVARPCRRLCPETNAHFWRFGTPERTMSVIGKSLGEIIPNMIYIYIYIYIIYIYYIYIWLKITHLLSYSWHNQPENTWDWPKHEPWQRNQRCGDPSNVVRVLTVITRGH